jgi:DNA-binding response OmpR family regulator
MNPSRKRVVILLAEDDDDDYRLTRDALQESHILNDVRRVADGEQLMDYLYRRKAFADPSTSPTPGLILLDLNMPKKDGRECLRELKSDVLRKLIPIVVLTTSKSEEDVIRSYQLGVNSFIRKPVSFDGLVEAVRVLGRYWFEIVEIPSLAQSATS